MYTPKTTPIALLIGGLIFCSFGFGLGTVSPFHATFIKGEVATYSTTPEIRYLYEGKEYISKTSGSATCNNHPCNEVGEEVTIIVDTNNPNIFLTLGELTLIVTFPLIGCVMVLAWIYFYTKSKRRKDIILSLQLQGSYIDAAIIDMEVQRSKSKRGGSRIIGYKYICKNIKTGEEYDSDIIPSPVFEVGSSVKVIEDKSLYPDLYWVDLNTVTQSQVGSTVAQQYQDKKLQIEEKNFRSQAQMIMKYSQSIPLLFGMGIPIIFIGITLPFIGFTFFGGILIGLGIWSIPGFLQERKIQKIRSKNISLITTVSGVEKMGNWKLVTLGYIPPEEKKEATVDITTINDGGGPSIFHFMGYPYRFTIEINGLVRVTENFSKPFPKKYAPGAKIRVYCDDMMYTGEFVTDLESIDELN